MDVRRSCAEEEEEEERLEGLPEEDEGVGHFLHLCNMSSVKRLTLEST